VCNIADAVKAKLRSDKTITLSLDEWNVWEISKYHAQEFEKWELAPRVIEDEYNVADSVVVGNLLISILRRSDRVKMACLAQLVNVIAPIRAEVGHPAWRQTTFYPFSYTAKYGRGKTLVTRIESDDITTERYGKAKLVDAITTYDAESKTASIFVVNRSLTESQELSVVLDGFTGIGLLDQASIGNSDLSLTNNLENPNRITPDITKSAKIDGNVVSVNLPPASWQVIHLSVSEG
jgi:alpha-N-arabinofuranosidase